MKTALIAASLALAAVTPASAAAAPTNKNYGKADNYGSNEFAALNQCYIVMAQNPISDDKARKKALTDCMSERQFSFCRDCQIFGNSGPKCKNDALGADHSWCWATSNKGEQK